MITLSLPKLFRQRITEKLSSQLGEQMIWDKCDMHALCCLRIPAAATDGFDIEVHININDISVYAGGRARMDFRLKGNQEELVRDAVELVYDLLSPKMRLRAELSDGTPVCWYVEFSRNNQWEIKEKILLLSWDLSRYIKYFKKQRSEKIYQNNRLPIFNHSETGVKT